MLASHAQPTIYPDVNPVLAILLSGARDVLGDHFVGMYLGGSLAGGDFDPETSDIDFLVVTTSTLPDALLPRLAAMHARIATSGLPGAGQIEGSYIPLAALRRHDPADANHPTLGFEGGFRLDGHGSEWIIQRHVLRERGVVLAGPEPSTLIDRVTPDDLRQAARGTLREWWAPQLDDPWRLHAPEYSAYAVLTMCRALFTLEHGAVASKPAAARWATATLGEPWAGVIEQARAWRPGAPPVDLAAALALVSVTLDHAGLTPAGDEQ